MKTAIIQIPDTGCIDSIVNMLRAVDVQCLLCSSQLQDMLRRIGCDTVQDHYDLVRGGSYDPVAYPMESADVKALEQVDYFFDCKMHRNGPKVWSVFPHLQARSFWLRCNGGWPEVTERGGDEVNLECRIQTSNLWYREDPAEVCPDTWKGPGGSDWAGKSFACWPPFVRWDHYIGACETRVREEFQYEPPMGLLHNSHGWGYGELVERVRGLGVKIYGSGSLDGQLPHKDVAGMLSRTLAFVHMKSSDAPGYALYEAIAAGVPVVIPRRLITRMHMEELFVEGETCLCWDVWSDKRGALPPYDHDKCISEIGEHLAALQDREFNRKIGLAARDRLDALMWSDKHKLDVDLFREWLEAPQ